MKISDVTLTLFGWSDIPATQYGRHTGTFSGKSELGLLAIRTDDGVVGQVPQHEAVLAAVAQHERGVPR